MKIKKTHDMKTKTALKTLGWIGASIALSSGFSSAAVIFSDDFSEADGTVLAGKSPDTGLLWEATGGGTAIAVSGNAVDTSGAARTGFANFSRSTTTTEITTVVLNNLAPGIPTANAANFFKGFAHYTLFTGGSAGTAQIIFGDLSSTTTTWGIQNAATAATSVNPTNNRTVNTATFVYNPVTGIASLSLSNLGGGETNPVASLNVGTNKTFDSLRFANGSTGDLKFTNISVDATTVPEPSAALLGAVGALALMRRRR